MNVYGSTLASGGGGTSDYSDLSNKPSINGVTLSGNKTTSDLGISSPISYSTSEQDTGLKWIDNKKIYQKTFTGTLTATSAVGTVVSTTFTVGASVDSVVFLQAAIKNPSGTTYQIVPTLDFTNNRFLRISVDNYASSNQNTVFIQNAWFTSNATYYVTMQYTKA